MVYRMSLWLLLLVILSAGISVAVAQDEVTPDPFATATPAPVVVEAPPPDPVTEEPGDPPATTPENLLGQLFALLKDSTYMVWAAAGVVVIVGLIKVLASGINHPIQGNAAITLTLIVQVVIWLGWAIANYFGEGESFKLWYLRGVDVIRALLPLAGAIFTGQIFYQQAAKHNVPILGYKVKPRTPAVPTVTAP